MSVEQVFRDRWGRVVATMMGRLGDLTLAEEVTQEAFAVAVERWPRDGTPTHPTAWLITTAHRRALNQLRRERTFAAKAHLLHEPPPEHDEDTAGRPIPDERLELLFLCCHRALAVEAQVALTLRALGGLTTAEIARAFLVPEPTMAQRIVRAKRKIAAAQIPFGIPHDDLMTERIDAVLAVLYLIFNAGYDGREELAGEALRLGRVTAELLPDHSEAQGLLALMLLLHARSEARFRDGELVMLDDQDPSLFDHEQIAEGRRLLDHALQLGGRGPYVHQAAIAALHVEEPKDWAQIAELYGELSRLTDSPVVELSRAVAVAEVHGPAAALTIVDALPLDGYHYLHATRAELLRRLGRSAQARAAYDRALELVDNDAERRHLERRRQTLG